MNADADEVRRVDEHDDQNGCRKFFAETLDDIEATEHGADRDNGGHELRQEHVVAVNDVISCLASWRFVLNVAPYGVAQEV